MLQVEGELSCKKKLVLQVWHALNAKGELSLAQLKKEVNGKTPLFDWAIGWLAREGKITITREKRSFRVALKEAHARAAGTP